MEQALLVNNLEDLKFFDGKKFSRICFGTEFCEKLLPREEEMRAIVQFCAKNHINCSLVTPWCTDEGLRRIRNIIKIMPKNSEVIFNDWGVFELLDKKRVTPVLGRLLISIKRDPRIVGRGEPIPSALTNKRRIKNSHFLSNPLGYAQLSNLNSGDFQEFLLSNKIRRVNLDNVAQGYDYKLNRKISASLHYPYVFITTSRKCLFANFEKLRKDKKIEINKCKFECANYAVTADMPKSQKKIIIKGNSQFYINNKQPGDFEKLNIDRLIFSPRVPSGGKKARINMGKFLCEKPQIRAMGRG